MILTKTLIKFLSRHYAHHEAFNFETGKVKDLKDPLWLELLIWVIVILDMVGLLAVLAFLKNPTVTGQLFTRP